MTFTQAIASGFQNYVNFNGRAARSAFWYWFLFTVLVSIAAGLIDAALFPASYVSPVSSLAGLACSCRAWRYRFGDCMISTAAAGGIC